MGINPNKKAAKATAGLAALPDVVLRQFDPESTEYDQRQLYRILQKAVRESVLPPGMKLPPTRALAAALGIARNTVVHVYEQLAIEGFLLAGIGRGTYVRDVGPRRVRAAIWAAGVKDPVRKTSLSKRGKGLVDGAGAGRLRWGAFTPGVPEVRLFPGQVWTRLQTRVWRNSTPGQLSYATGAGDPDLREALANHLQQTRGVACSAEQLLITSGTQQSLHLVAQMLTDPGDVVWLEDPGYWGARSVFSSVGLKLVPIGVDTEGMAPTAQQLRKPPRIIFLSPSHQYPTGAVMSQARRRMLLEYASKHGIWIIEDDYDSEFRYRARPLPSLQGQDAHARVLYLGTFSKTLFPALRIAYMVLPPDLVDGFATAMNELFREGQTIQQAVLARFMADGHYATHIRRMRGVYRSRHDALMLAIARHFGKQLPVLGSDAGLHLVLGLPNHVDDRAVVQQVARAGVACRPLSMYSMQQVDTAPKGLLLGYGAAREEEIAANFSLLATPVQGFL